MSKISEQLGLFGQALTSLLLAASLAACGDQSTADGAASTASTAASSETPSGTQTATAASTNGQSKQVASSASTASSPASSFGISVAGNKFVSTASGEVVQLLGTSISGLEQGSTSLANGVENYGNPTDAGFKAMASWNMNIVRIPLNEDTWLGIHNCTNDGGSSATLQANLKQIVANANAAGLYVILDLHWTAPNAFGCPQGQGAMPDADNTVAFWSSVASSFKDNPAVLFEIFNEPFATNNYSNWVESLTASTPSGQSGTDLDILINGGTYDNGYMYQCNNGCSLTMGQEYTANTGAFHTVGYQQIINAIRATGANNVILMNPLGWAGQIATWLNARPTDPAGQLAVGWHEDGGSTADAQQVLALNLPIVITEAYSIGDATFNWAIGNGVGFSYWSWVDWGGGGLLSNAKTSTPNSNGTQLKSSYCSRPSVNSLSQC